MVALCPTSAMRIIRSTISIGVCTYGTVPSSHAQAWGCALRRQSHCEDREEQPLDQQHYRACHCR